MKEYSVKIHLDLYSLSNITTRMTADGVNKLLKAVEERNYRKSPVTFTLNFPGPGKTSMCFFLKNVTLVEFTEMG